MTDDGLVTAHILDGHGGSREIAWSRIATWSPDEGPLWVHLDYTDPAAARWLWEDSGLDEVAVEALLAEETRPRAVNHGAGLLVTLRGVNLNPGADPEDMVSIRLYVDEHRVISTRKRRLLSVEDMRGAMARGMGPTSSADLLVQLAEGLVGRMAEVISDIDDRVSELENDLDAADHRQLRPTIAGLRRQIIELRRYLAPQREALARLWAEKAGWLNDSNRLHLREIADRMTRYVEELDMDRERALLAQEYLANSLAEQMNNRMYVLSLAAAIFLPLSFITGLLGINVGGIPGTENPWAFLAVVIAIAAIGAGQFLYLRHRRWF
ncbi:MAG: zinc transporter ZntB [Gammaproteobacteria bacterium]|nr:zinc transporter ZntB [Gammaproteobacteria bacterium]